MVSTLADDQLFSWGEPARIRAGAPRRYQPGRVACVRGTMFEGDLHYVLEFLGDDVLAVPAELLERVLPRFDGDGRDTSRDESDGYLAEADVVCDETTLTDVARASSRALPHAEPHDVDPSSSPKYGSPSRIARASCSGTGSSSGSFAAASTRVRTASRALPSSAQL